MHDQEDRIELLHRAVEAMAEQILQLQAELSSMRAEAAASNQRQRYMMARVDQIDAMQASLSALEQWVLANNKLNHTPRKPQRSIHRQVNPVRRRSSLQRLGLIMLGVLPLFVGLVMALRGLLSQREAISIVRDPVKPQPKAAIPILQLTASGNTWLEVQASGGKLLHFGMAKPGRYRFPVRHGLRIRAGRPDLINVNFQGSSTELGGINETDWHVFGLR